MQDNPPPGFEPLGFGNLLDRVFKICWRKFPTFADESSAEREARGRQLATRERRARRLRPSTARSRRPLPASRIRWWTYRIAMRASRYKPQGSSLRDARSTCIRASLLWARARRACLAM